MESAPPVLLIFITKFETEHNAFYRTMKNALHMILFRATFINSPLIVMHIRNCDAPLVVLWVCVELVR